MKYVLYILRFFYRIRFWLILLPVLAACYMIWKTRDIARYYEVRTTVYTGVGVRYRAGVSPRGRLEYEKQHDR
mgnify:CR=1 FL=1